MYLTSNDFTLFCRRAICNTIRMLLRRSKDKNPKTKRSTTTTKVLLHEKNYLAHYLSLEPFAFFSFIYITIQRQPFLFTTLYTQFHLEKGSSIVHVLIKESIKKVPVIKTKSEGMPQSKKPKRDQQGTEFSNKS